MKARIKLVTAMLIFGSIGLFVRSADVSSGMLALARGIIGTLFLTAANAAGTVWSAGKRKMKMSEGISSEESGSYHSLIAIKQNGILLAASGAAIGINWICLFESYRYTTIAAATLCYYLAPVFVILASPVFLKEKLTPVKLGCIAASLAGMVLVADLFAASGQGAENGKGILFGVTAAVFYASVMVMNQFLKNIKAADRTISQLGVAALILAPYVVVTEDIAAVSFRMQTVGVLLFVGIVHTGIAYLLYFGAMAQLDGQTVALLSYIDPVAAILLSALLLHEPMSAAQAVGAVLILGAAVMSEWQGNKKHRKISRESRKREEAKL